MTCSFLACIQLDQVEARRTSFRNPAIGAVTGGLREVSLAVLTNYLLDKDTLVADRTRALLTVGSQTLGRGDDLLKLALSDMGVVDLGKYVGPGRAKALVGLLEWRKQEAENSGKQFLSLVRNQDVFECGMSAIALYWFRRFDKEPFPDLQKGPSTWYNIVVFASTPTNADKETILAFTTVYVPLKEVLNDNGVITPKCLHFMRNNGSKEAELKGQGDVSPDSWRQLGGWGSDLRTKVYMNGVPVSSVMASAGHTAAHWKHGFTILREINGKLPEVEISFLMQMPMYAQSIRFLEFAKKILPAF